MDADLFDALARSLRFAGSRRAALPAILAGALSPLGLARPDDAAAAKSRKCKPKCGECEKCRKGDCDRKDGKKVCKRGKCQAKAEGTACGTGGVCQTRQCVCPSGTEACGGACVSRCGAGTTRNPVTCGCCQLAGQTCNFSGSNNCCSESCPGGTCESKSAGDACAFGVQCGSGICRRGTCACSALLNPCFNNFDCCDRISGANEKVGCNRKDGFPGILCCVNGSGQCATDADCCEEFTCISGTCGN